MRRWSFLGTILACVTCTLLAAEGATARAGEPFRVDVLDDGVLLFQPTAPGPGRTNSLAIEQAAGWVVVEAQPTPDAARELLAALGKRSKKPIRYLVLSHPHAEAAGGASVFPESTIVVSSIDTQEALADPEHDFGGVLRAAAPDTWREPPRRLPTLVAATTIRLLDDVNPVHVVPLRHAHSRGNLFVLIPESDVAYLGPVLYRDGNPYAGSADVSGWLGTFNGILSDWEVGTLVPLRGEPAGRDDLRPLRDALAWLRGQVNEGFVEGLAPEAIPAWLVARPGFAERFDVEARPSFHRLLVERALDQALVERAKRGR
jgi:glyoxylase-like metal-dependent hydrolase (beta-lactamase superfamily II)